MLRRYEQIVSGHFLWLRQSEQKQERWRNIGEDPVPDAELLRVFGDVDAMHKILGVRGVWRAVGIAHLLAISVIGRDDTFTVEVEKLWDDAGDTFIHRFDRFDSGF